MKGKLYGIGIGPGNPELMTLRAKRLLDGCGYIACPVKRPGEMSVALNIIKNEVDLEDKNILELWFRMDPSNEVRKKYRAEAVKEVTDILDRGEDVCMITLGDVSVYSTYMRIDRMVRDAGYDTEIVPGIPSFCAGAAKAGVPLMIGSEGLAIVSSAEDNEALHAAFDGFENIVIMKAFGSIPKLIGMMKEHDIDASNGKVISCIGMPEEYIGPMDPCREYGYFTTVIVKKKGL